MWVGGCVLVRATQAATNILGDNQCVDGELSFVSVYVFVSLMCCVGCCTHAIARMVYVSGVVCFLFFHQSHFIFVCVLCFAVGLFWD